MGCVVSAPRGDSWHGLPWSAGEYISWTWQRWAQRIDNNFEKLFYIHRVPHPQFEQEPKLINVRGMYKDSHGASQFWADYQLRCNFPVAMVVVSGPSPGAVAVAFGTRGLPINLTRG